MKTEQIVMCVVALVLGMLVANMLTNVCGCKTGVEGFTFNNYPPNPSPTFQALMGDDAFCTVNAGGPNITDACGQGRTTAAQLISACSSPLGDTQMGRTDQIQQIGVSGTNEFAAACAVTCDQCQLDTDTDGGIMTCSNTADSSFDCDGCPGCPPREFSTKDQCPDGFPRTQLTDSLCPSPSSSPGGGN